MMDNFNGLQMGQNSKKERMEMKRCYKCGEAKLLEEFYKDRGNTDGFTNICRECTALKAKERRERLIPLHDEKFYRRKLAEAV